ncbi:hypothetical protein V8C86DRAFT_2558462, partial [Haematococcus lacustris]
MTDVSADAELVVAPLLSRVTTVAVQCADGKVCCSRDLLRLASPAFQDKDGSFKAPKTTCRQWQLTFGQLYPISPRPSLTADEWLEVLPLAAELDMRSVCDQASVGLTKLMALQWSLKVADSGYIGKWLVLADKYQLSELRDSALEHWGKLSKTDVSDAFGDNIQLLKDMEEMAISTVARALHLRVVCQSCSNKCACPDRRQLFCMRTLLLPLLIVPQ